MTRAQNPRRRCVKCRSYLGFMVLEGLYCSLLCQGWSPEEIAEARRLEALSEARRRAWAEFNRSRRILPGERVPRGCRSRTRLRKIQYPTMEEAQVAADRTNDGMAPYRCANCNYFHIGHAKRARGAR